MTKKTFIPTVGIAEVSDYIPTKEEEKKQSANVHFRWSEFEIKRAKKIAEKLGMPYQTYLKSTLKQAMDNDEKKFM